MTGRSQWPESRWRARSGPDRGSTCDHTWIRKSIVSMMTVIVSRGHGTYRSDRTPARSKNPPKVRVYAEIIHWRLVSDTSKFSWIDDKATLALVMKTLSRNWEPEVTSRMRAPFHEARRPISGHGPSFVSCFSSIGVAIPDEGVLLSSPSEEPGREKIVN